jgi:hypothetical protein
MGQRGDILNAGDLQTRVLKLNDGLLTTRAGAFHLYFNFLHPGFLGDLGRVLGGATCRGVLLRAPLKNPPFPADAQAIVSPLVSVMVTIVLLNVALM